MWIGTTEFNETVFFKCINESELYKLFIYPEALAIGFSNQGYYKSDNAFGLLFSPFIDIFATSVLNLCPNVIG